MSNFHDLFLEKFVFDNELASRKVNDGLALKQFHGREKDKMESHATLLLTLPYL